MRSTRWMTHAMAWVALALGATVAAGAGGGATNDPQTIYTSIARRQPPAGVIATVTVQHVSHELNSVAGKYRLIPVLLRAVERQAPVLLSREHDRLSVLSGDRRVAASFELSALDRALWDSLPQQTRNWLTYPEQLARDGAVMVYAFVPLAELKTAPTAFEYTIRSLPAPLLLEPEAKKAAMLTGVAGG